MAEWKKMTVAGRYEYLKQSTLKPEAFDHNSKEYCSDLDKEELPEPAEYAADINPIADILTAGD